jgi:hypothetical protein
MQAYGFNNIQFIIDQLKIVQIILEVQAKVHRHLQQQVHHSMLHVRIVKIQWQKFKIVENLNFGLMEVHHQ